MKQPLPLQHAKKRAYYLVLGLLVAYGLLLALVWLLPENLADEPFTVWLQQHLHPVGVAVARFLGEAGKPYAVVLQAGISAVVLVFYGYRREAAFITATLLADAGNLVIKHLAGRPRPEQGLVAVLEEAGNNGFPSGHTVHALVFYGFWLVLLPLFRNLAAPWRKLLTGVLLLLMVLTPWSRVYMGMHWPSDVIGGGFFGIICLALICAAYFSDDPKLPS